MLNWSSILLETTGWQCGTCRAIPPEGQKSCWIYPPTSVGHWPRVHSDIGSQNSCIPHMKAGHAPTARESVQAVGCLQKKAFSMHRMVSIEAIWVEHWIFSIKVDPKLTVSEQYQVVLWDLLHLVQYTRFIHYTSDGKSDLFACCYPIWSWRSVLGVEYLRASPLLLGMSQTGGGGASEGQEAAYAL